MADVAGFASSFVSAVVNFLIMALSFNKKEETLAEPTTKTCPFCQSEISIKATRCPHCTSVLEDCS